jgi:hypothetical protein
MKVYVENLNTSNLNTGNIHQYKEQIIITSLIYSQIGIYTITSKEIYKLIPNDSDISKYNLDNYKLLVDTSYYKKQKPIFHIPYDHHIESFEKIIFRLNDKSKVSLVIEIYKKENDLYKFNYLCNLKDIYFQVDNSETIQNLFIQDDIVTFLSLLNNVKNI